MRRRRPRPRRRTTRARRPRPSSITPVARTCSSSSCSSQRLKRNQPEEAGTERGSRTRTQAGEQPHTHAGPAHQPRHPQRSPRDPCALDAPRGRPQYPAICPKKRSNPRPHTHARRPHTRPGPTPHTSPYSAAPTSRRALNCRPRPPQAHQEHEPDPDRQQPLHARGRHSDSDTNARPRPQPSAHHSPTSSHTPSPLPRRPRSRAPTTQPLMQEGGLSEEAEHELKPREPNSAHDTHSTTPLAGPRTIPHAHPDRGAHPASRPR
jgi:hypothetical protein